MKCRTLFLAETRHEYIFPDVLALISYKTMLGHNKKIFIQLHSDWIRVYIYIIFPEIRGFFYISCKLSPLETICMKCQNLNSGKNKKNSISLSPDQQFRPKSWAADRVSEQDGHCLLFIKQFSGTYTGGIMGVRFV